MTAALNSSTVPLPFVTELMPVVMASTSTTSLPQSKTDSDVKGLAQTTSNDPVEKSDSKDATSTKDAISINNFSIVTNDSVDNPVSPKTAPSSHRFQFNRGDERDAGHWIEKAHTCVRQGHPEASLDKDKDIEKLSQMVSQLTHLLAAAGAGRETAKRALAYMNGPDKPQAKPALIEAKKDRKKRNNSKGLASGATFKSTKLNDSGDTTSTKEASSATDKDLKTSEGSAATSLEANNAIASTTNSADNKTIDEGVTIQANDVSTEVGPKIEQTRKISGESKAHGSVRRKRWWRRNRKSSGNQNKDQENKSQQKTTTSDPQPEKVNGNAAKDEQSKDMPLTAATNAAATAA